jgi:hypothetical protein
MRKIKSALAHCCIMVNISARFHHHSKDTERTGNCSLAGGLPSTYILKWFFFSGMYKYTKESNYISDFRCKLLSSLVKNSTSSSLFNIFIFFLSFHRELMVYHVLWTYDMLSSTSMVYNLYSEVMWNFISFYKFKYSFSQLYITDSVFVFISHKFY